MHLLQPQLVLVQQAYIMLIISTSNHLQNQLKKEGTVEVHEKLDLRNDNNRVK